MRAASTGIETLAVGTRCFCLLEIANEQRWVDVVVLEIEGESIVAVVISELGLAAAQLPTGIKVEMGDTEVSLG